MIKNYLLVSCFIIFFYKVTGTVTKEDYQQADSTKNFTKLVYRVVQSPSWIDSSHYLLYKTKTDKGDGYFIIDAAMKEKRPAFDQEKLCLQLNKLLDTVFQPYLLPIKKLKFNKDLTMLKFETDRFKLVYDLRSDVVTLSDTISKLKGSYWGNEKDELANNPVKSPDSNWVAHVEQYNVVLKNRKNGKTLKLTHDGNENLYYSSYMEWSPDSRYLATMKITENPKKYLEFVESSPDESFLPKLHKFEYLRPGDSLRIKVPVLFNVEKKKIINIETSEYKDQFSLSNIKWRSDSKAFTFEYNRRGHQCFQVVSIDTETGNKKVVINETSATFIDYSSKYFRFDIEGGKKIIWASERDGWNHLYLVDAVTGNIINQITKGEWVVRGVEHVDTLAHEVIFKASGVNRDEDPYFIHYYKINYDGTGMVDLSPEKYNHRLIFSYDRKYFLNTYSAVNFPPISVLGDIEKGNAVMEVEKADVTKLLEKGYQMPEPFMALGRDGKTEIWGNIYRPTHFDPSKKYPVIEYIYAGPHSSFVQKWFSPYTYYISGLAEMGFIIVQIDGMGTSNRSKAFHDVCYKNLKDAGFEDRITWIKEIAKKYKYLDIEKVGIYGGSAGGQSSTAALLFHPEFYKVAVSACGCHDNRLDKIWWNEQWMGYPVDESYVACSNIENAGNLKGDLMLIVGEIDNNVDPASTFRLAKALIKEKKEFELIVLPGTNHTLGGEYGERERRDFFVRHVLGENPPSWNE